jgi:hypothetical protein
MKPLGKEKPEILVFRPVAALPGARFNQGENRALFPATIYPDPAQLNPQAK